jgi:glycosyltransferase involved in cell wall biosynthesis
MASPIPVAIMVDRYITGGTQRQAIELLKRIDRQRFKIYPVCFHDDGPWRPQVAELGDPISCFPIHGFGRPATARQLRAFAAWCRRNRIAVLHTWDIYSNVFGLAGAALAGVPVRIGSRRGLGGPARVRRLQRVAYRFAHRIIANSRAAAEQVAGDGVPPGRITIVPNGIDLDRFRARTSSTNAKRIAMVACLRPGKRVDVLIAAAPRVLERHPTAEFVIAGDGPCREELIALARSTGVDRAFQFLGQCDNVATVLADAGLFVLPSASEAFPNAILEAMATALPVVATRVGGIPELVEEGVTGHLVDPGDSQQLADSLIEVLDAPERGIELGRNGRQRIEETYSFDRMVKQFESLYETETDRARLDRPARSDAPAVARLKPMVKNTLMRTYLRSRLPAARDRMYARLGRGRLTVLAYHQIMDPATDGSCVGTTAFRDQMEYLKAHYRVVPLSRAVDALRRAGSAERLVAVTFDDGYLDNATAAAPILRALDLPATFFVSTDMIGGGRPFPHDVLRRRVPQAHMTWDDVRSLAGQGFEIGSHTCSHADMGAVSLEQARRELRESRDRIEAELQRPATLFAFPYGRQHNMRPDTLRAAQDTYEVCCSAYGGHNTAPADPGNVRRIVISSGVTSLAFRALLEGWPMMRLTNPAPPPSVEEAGLIAPGGPSASHT